MKKIAILLLGILLTIQIQSQEEETDKRPARNPFNSLVLNDTYSTQNLSKNSLQFDLEHRFGTINNGYKDVFGLYAMANMRMGLAYGITDKLSVWSGLTKTFMIADFGFQYKILEQTRSKFMPVTLTYTGIANIENQNEEYYQKFIQQLTYFNQISISRKFNRILTLQLSGNYAHYNLIDSAFYKPMKHDNFGFTFSGKIRLTPGTLLLFEYGSNITALSNRPTPLKGQDWYGKPNLGIGVEFATAGHSFQIFLSNYQSINPARNMVYNNNSILDGAFVIGFNLIRTWDFNKD